MLYKHIIQEENKNVGLKVGGGGTNKKSGGLMPPCPLPRFLRQYIYICVCMYVCMHVCIYVRIYDMYVCMHACMHVCMIVYINA